MHISILDDMPERGDEGLLCAGANSSVNDRTGAKYNKNQRKAGGYEQNCSLVRCGASYKNH
jgi:hypothetical protein